jgi:hypothetical protein
MTIPSGDIWIGIVEVAGPPSNPALAGGVGAFVAYLTFASDADLYGLDARRSADEQGLTVTQVLWAEPLSARVQRVEVEQYLLTLADSVAASGSGAFGTFHAWDEKE